MQCNYNFGSSFLTNVLHFYRKIVTRLFFDSSILRNLQLIHLSHQLLVQDDRIENQKMLTVASYDILENEASCKEFLALFNNSIACLREFEFSIQISNTFYTKNNSIKKPIFQTNDK